MKEYVIAVGVDYSDASIAALDLALDHAATRPPALLVPVLVLAPAGPKELMAPEGDFVVNAKGNLVQLVKSRLELRRDIDEEGVAIEPSIGFGDAATYLVKMTDELNADLLVVGTHGRRGIGRMVLGSVAGTVIQGAGCPVLVARPPKGRQEESEAPAPAPPPQVRGDEKPSSIISEPHIADGAVVLYVLDEESGRTFVCSFQSRTSVTVESLEREWVAISSAAERARALRAAETYVRENSGEFQQLIDELNRRRHAAQSEQSLMN